MIYHLNCEQCGTLFGSNEGFPKPQLCMNCMREKAELWDWCCKNIYKVYFAQPEVSGHNGKFIVTFAGEHREQIIASGETFEAAVKAAKEGERG